MPKVESIRRGRLSTLFAVAALSSLASGNSLAITAAEAARAKWAARVNLSLVPVAGAVRADGKVVFWSAENRLTFASGSNTYTTLFDPATNTAVERNVTETGHDMFCPGTARLPDGRLLVNGGISAPNTSIYDPVANTWTRAATMNIARGYNASVPLWDGTVMTLGGSWSGGTAGGKNAEIYTPSTNTWRTLSGVPYDPYLLDGVYNGWQTDSHAALIPTANGKVLMAGPAVNMAWIDPRGNGSSTPAGRRGDDTPSLGGNWVMYEPGKILKLGGATWNGNTAANANAYVIDTTGGSANVRKLAPMAYPRMYPNSVVLPNGHVVTIGGQTFVQEFSDSNAVLAAELWDPLTESFAVLPSMSVARNYHSIALLLPDGRVVSAGGGLCGCSADHPDLQILSPPYLFNADGSNATRPVITSAPTQLGYGTTATVVTNSPVTAFSLVRLGAVTHTVNNDQRRVPLSFSGGTNNSYTLSIPTNQGILLPGQWMLFAMNANGTPSVASIVTVTSSGAPVLQNPGNVNATVGQAVSVPVTASTPSGTLGFSATGLPAGLTINATNGTISGTPTAVGTSLVTIRATNGTRTVSTDIVISASTIGTGTGLLGQYFANRDLGGAVALQRIEVPNFDGATAAPGTGVPADGFSARWSGSIEPAASGATQIRTNSDDGVRVWIDNRLVIDNWTDHAPTLNTAAVNMVAGQRYPILIEYYEGGGPGSMQLQWQPPGATAFATVPTTRLYPATAPSAVNLASGRTATQTSIFESAVASRAVDGNINGAYGSGSVTHTNSAAQNWWQVDLGRLNRIDLVQLWNRTDCCSERLNNFVLFVSSTDMTGRTFDQLNADPAVIKRTVGVSRVIANIGIPVGANGRYVRVQLAGTNFLSLAEVQVFGAAAFGTPTINTIAAQQNIVGTSVAVQASATDPDGNALTYGATGLPAGVTLNSTTGLISGTPSAAGTFNVTVTAQNAGGLSASTSFTWTILGAIPQVTSLPAPVASSGSTVTYSPALSGGATSQYSWNFGDGTADTAFSDSASVTHVFAAPGVYTVTLTIRTSDGRTSTYRMVQAINTAGTTALSRASSSLMLEPRTSAPARLWVVNPDNDSVSVFDTSNNARLAEITVGSGPRTVALAADGRIWVVNEQSATISIISPTSLSVVQTINAPRASQPFGIVFSPIDGSAFVALEATGVVLKLNGTSGATVATLSVGDHPRHVAINAAGTQLFVSRFITRPLPGESTATVATTDGNGAKVGGEVLVVDPAAMSIVRTLVLAHSERVDSEAQGRGFPNYLGAVAISPDARTAWVPSKQDNLLRGTLRDGRALDFQNTVRAVSSRIDLTSNAEDLTGRIDHDNASVASAAVYHPNGAYLFVALETSRQVAVVDAAGKRELFRYEVGLAPQGVVVSADGTKLYVGNFMSRTVSVVDLQPLIGSGQTSAPTIASLSTIATEKLAANVLRGKQLFYDARDTRLARDAYMSCATCHNDGGHDGRVWDLTGQSEGLRNTINLRGRAGMGNGFLHWSANFDEVQDFEAQIRNLAGGTGLMSNADFTAGTRFQPLGDAKAGVSADLDALAAYVGSLGSYDRSPYGNADGSLTAAGQAGRNIFIAGNCASCHSGANFTGSGDASQLKNVGTIKASSGNRLGAPLTGIDIPTLRDVWATAPYLHDGSAATLSAAVSAHSGVSLSASELASLSEYLQQVGGTGSTIILRARANLAAGIGANVELRLNGSIVGTVVVDATAFQDYSFTVPGVLPGDRIDVVFTNDAWSPEDRNLYVESVKVDTTTILPTAAGVTVDRGAGAAAFDGVDVIAGQVGLYWNAALRMTMPGAPAADTTPPTVTLTAPAAGASLSGTVTLSADAADNVGVVGVQFLVDGVAQGAEDTTAPYSIAWNAGAVAAGGHAITARARDAAGNQTTSAAVNVTTTTGTLTTVTIRARANLAGGVGANMELWVNGAIAGTAVVNATAFADYPFNVAAIRAGDRIDVVFTNDTATPEDRNLYVESVKYGTTTILPTTAGVTVDRGSGAAAFDGVDVIAGQGGIYWNAALRMVAP